MRVGLDTISFSSWNLDSMGLLQKTIDYRLEGLQLGSQAFLKDADLRKRFMDKLQAHGMYVELGGSGVNPRDSGKSVDDLVESWKPLFPLAAEMGSPTLNTCFGLLKERTMASPTFAEQYKMTTEVLSKLAPIAEEHNVVVTMELHVDLTYTELANMMTQVNSPGIGVNLDTANALGMMEDPVEAARVLAPYAKTTHYKDTCVYATPEGYNWQGGAPLGTGLVDLPTITELLYQHNPDINLNIEDGFGFIAIPMYDEAFLESFDDLTPTKMAKFFQFLEKGRKQLEAGVHPRPEEFKSYDVPMVMASRMWHSAEYAFKLRDDIVARHSK